MKKSKDMLSLIGEKLVNFLDNLTNILDNADKVVEEKIESHKTEYKKGFSKNGLRATI